MTKLIDSRSAITGWAEAPNRKASWSDGAARDRYSSDVRWVIIDEVAPLPNETVIEKSAPSAFFGTLLAAQLNHLKIDSLIVGGEATSGCVRATAVDGRSYRYNVTIVDGMRLRPARTHARDEPFRFT